jgi:hypothetical protein
MSVQKLGREGTLGTLLGTVSGSADGVFNHKHSTDSVHLYINTIRSGN